MPKITDFISVSGTKITDFNALYHIILEDEDRGSLSLIIIPR